MRSEFRDSADRCHGATGVIGEGLIKAIAKFGFHGAEQRGGGTALRATRPDRAGACRRRCVDSDSRHLRETAPLCGHERHLAGWE